MTEDADRKRETADSFGRSAGAYLESVVHRTGDDLGQLATWAGSADRALDVATGAGHTAGAVLEAGAGRVIATDASPPMVATAETEYPGIEGTVADAERLPFQSEAFDAVTCRIAAHHFPDPRAFVAEVARVVKPSGTFAFEDNIAPDDQALDNFLNRVERLRDPTHVRSHTEAEWLGWLREAGFSVEQAAVMEKEIPYRPWVEQLDVPASTRKEIEQMFKAAPSAATERFDIEIDDAGRLESFSNLKLLVRAQAE